MDPFSPLSTSSLNIHSLEIYTASLNIQGNATGPFRRSSDLVNRKDREYIVLQEARMAPLGRQPNPTPLSTPLTVARKHVHLVAVQPQPEPDYVSGGLNSGNLSTASLSSGSLSSGNLSTGNLGGGKAGGREFVVRKTPTPCYVLTGTYAVLGMCHLIEGSTVENLLDISDFFLALTGVTIHLLAVSASPLQRDLVLINKEHIHAMYLIPQANPAQPPQLDQTGSPSSV